MSYNGSGTFQINTTGQPVVTGTVISSTAFNALTADLATGLSTAITKDGQTATTARIPFAAGINSSLATDSSSTSTGSIITAGGIGVAKAAYIGTTLNVASTATATKLIPTGTSVTGNGLYLPATNALGLSTNGTNAVYIDASQNVGIGTSSPTKPLTVKASSSDGAGIRLFANASEDVILDFFSANGTTQKASVSSDANSALKFNTVNTERMRINSSGNLLVGTTSTISGAIVGIANVNAGAAGLGIGNTGGTSVSTCISFRNSNGEVGFIQTSGSATTYSTSSDYRLKENVTPMTGALSTVAQLKPVTYKWKNNGSDGQGFIAHELQEIVPDCVSGIKDAVDADGNPKYQGVDTSFLVATLTAAIQEQQALITALTARITALEAK